MKKEYRVKDSREFKDIMNNKTFYADPSFTIYVKPKKEQTARIGLSVGKKLGNAVTRNKIKRQIRMMAQNLYDFDENFDTIILVRNDYLNNTYETNEKRLEKLLKKVKL